MMQAKILTVLLLSFVLLELFGSFVQGLQCWSCENADSFGHCEEIGKFEECNPSQRVCGMEVRKNSFEQGGKIKVFKFCKQREACGNVLNQNDKSAVEVTQCNPKSPNSVCRCCCEGDRCNVGELQCLKLDKEEKEEHEVVEPPMTCTPMMESRENGEVRCTNGSNVASICRFFCSVGFYIEGSHVTICHPVNSLAKWSDDAPVCRRSRCYPQRPLSHGKMECSDEDLYGSICKFSCDGGYQLIGEETSICQADTPGSRYGVWSSVGQYCEINRCRNELSSPANGTILCSDRNNVGSVCEFQCVENYQLSGSRYSACQKTDLERLPTWSELTPNCERRQCRYMPPRPVNGHISCSDEKYINSVCKFRCDVGYELDGESQSVCVSDGSYKKFYGEGGMFWTNQSPTCKLKKCQAVETPQNGYVTCSRENFIASTCNFVCETGFSLQGASESTCIIKKNGDEGTLEWTGESPTCERMSCSTINLKNGLVDCSNNFNVGSECKFACTANNYMLYPSTATKTTCKSDGNWQGEFPCCSRPCPPFAVVDFVVVLDSSSSIGRENWPVMLNFLNSIIDTFEIGEDAANFGVIRYNKEVDTASIINLNTIRDDKTMLKELVSNLPYDGTGTRTGHAMKYAYDFMLSTEVGNRDFAADVMLVITDGRSQDNVKIPAEEIRRRGILTLAVGINPGTGRLDLEQLETIAGTPKRVFIVEDGFSALTPEYALKVSKSICPSPCEN